MTTKELIKEKKKQIRKLENEIEELESKSCSELSEFLKQYLNKWYPLPKNNVDVYFKPTTCDVNGTYIAFHGSYIESSEYQLYIRHNYYIALTEEETKEMFSHSTEPNVENLISNGLKIINNENSID
jgi:hypothetical protein